MTSCLLVLMLAGAPSQLGDSATSSEVVVDDSMADDQYANGCESCSSDEDGGCSSCGGCGRGRCGGCCDDYGWIRRAGPMPQTCYNPRHGCYSGNNRFMHRYPAFHGYYYRNPYNYRHLFDYPWHAELHEPTSMFSYNFEEESTTSSSTPTQADESDAPSAKLVPSRGTTTRRIAGFITADKAKGVRQASASLRPTPSRSTRRATAAQRSSIAQRASAVAIANDPSPTPVPDQLVPQPERRAGRWFQGGMFGRTSAR